MPFSPAALAALARLRAVRPADFEDNGYETLFPRSLNDIAILAPEIYQENDQAAKLFPRAFFPEDYGAGGNDPNVDDSVGIQRAIDNAQDAGNGIVSLKPGTTYYPSAKLRMDPSRVMIAGNGARIDFRKKAFFDPAAALELMRNPSFDEGSASWIVGTQTTRAPVFGNGEVRFDAPPDVYSYLEMGQPVTAAVGQKIRITLEVGHISTVTSGPNTFRQILVSPRAGGVIGGGLAGTSKTISNLDGNYRPGAIYVWDTFVTSANPFIRVASSANVSIKGLSVKVMPDNTCILIQTPQGGRLRGHNERCVENLKVAGRADQGGYVDVFEFETAVPGLSSRVNFYNVDASEGVGRALLFGNRAYLMNFHSCRFTASQACVDTLESPQDAGENIAFFGGNLGAGQCGIRNRGMAIRLFGTSIDFSRQFYVGSGSFEAHGGWFETYQHDAEVAARSDFGETQYRFDVHSGSVKLFGGFVQIHQGEPLAEAIFRVGRNSTIDLVDTDVFNMRTTSGAMCVGEGRIDAKIRGGTGKETEPVLSRTGINNRVLGDMDNASVVLNAWLVSISKQRQPDRRTVTWHTNRAFKGTLTRGSSTIAVASTTGLNVGFVVEGPGVVEGATITSFVTNQSITLSNPVSGNGEKDLLCYQETPYATAKLENEEGQGRTSGRALKLSKVGIGSTNLVAYIAIPVDRAHAVGGEIYLRVPPIAGSTGSPLLFFDATFAALGQGESNAVPNISERRLGITNQNIALDLAAGMDWTRLTYKTTRVDPSSTHDGYTPNWATHVLLVFNLASMPNNFVMYLDDMVASQM